MEGTRKKETGTARIDWCSLCVDASQANVYAWWNQVAPNYTKPHLFGKFHVVHVVWTPWLAARALAKIYNHDQLKESLRYPKTRQCVVEATTATSIGAARWVAAVTDTCIDQLPLAVWTGTPWL
jgi:hypothetical protein